MVLLEKVCPRMGLKKKTSMKKASLLFGKKRSPLECVFGFIFVKEKKASPSGCFWSHIDEEKKVSPRGCF